MQKRSRSVCFHHRRLESLIKEQIAASEGVSPSAISGFHILKRSIDARGRQAWIVLNLNAFINEPFQERPFLHFHFGNVSRSPKKVVIIGAGPAGLFAALQLIEKGIQPVILERGKEVRARRRDLAALNKEGIINPESNYCFGERRGRHLQRRQTVHPQQQAGRYQQGYCISLFILAQMRAFSMMHIRISAPISCLISLPPCAKPYRIAGAYSCLKKSNGFYYWR